MTTRNRKPLMTLYSDAQCPFSHQTRIVVQEKQIECQLVELVDGHWPEEVASANPYGQGPTLFDRDIVIFHSPIIMEYLDERFPHPSLMPNDPGARAQMRLMLHRLETDWLAMWPQLSGRDKSPATKAKKTLREDLTVLAPLFEQYDYLMSDEFSLIDCYIAPLLWRLPHLGIKLPDSAIAVERYAQKIFDRATFQASLSTAERGMR
ncbi:MULTISPECIES: glutathione S-transferase N-terminal domain-containing protein [unclassified Methylophaga]|jgi:RNA polymerase-associated protein|uniref:glutathione S-transferase N-terminal domain-containing protein n=1 Tax=unclassified Methylophaga TaxID=2629249 RepID=UPI000C9480A0|nr:MULTISPECIES: glutathione S-transferase N-terminal domain-containing protein [unclassified Methylophaga]MAK67327.1 stringent starvation protein A [Methylophaga sp.]MAY16869.1 stringent starvation protein A [Methylophaga sp.]HAO25063.1 stringent starvation protein A [Methylophaga sp.]HCD04637.1 stringent starvation protein A [Methylophaga sp.]|tara:strand:- start:5639 stop:6259 length:621 start_codon:yes stop_codon:yes gene_type:complete